MAQIVDKTLKIINNTGPALKTGYDDSVYVSHTVDAIGTYEIKSPTDVVLVSLTSSGDMEVSGSLTVDDIITINSPAAWKAVSGGSDIRLAEAAAGEWQFDGSYTKFKVGGMFEGGQSLAWGGGAAISDSSNVALLDSPNDFTAAQEVTRGTVTGQLFKGRVSGDGASRWDVLADGRMRWGDGTNAGDTNLYRSTTNTLKTDNAFVVGGVVTVEGAYIRNDTLTGGNFSIGSQKTGTGNVILDYPSSGTLQIRRSGGVSFVHFRDNSDMAITSRIILEGGADLQWMDAGGADGYYINRSGSSFRIVERIAGADSEKLRLASGSGYLGIGTTDPRFSVHAARSDFTQVALENTGAEVNKKVWSLRLTNISGASAFHISMGNDDYNNFNYGYRIIRSGQTANEHSFKVGTVEQVRINSNGLLWGGGASIASSDNVPLKDADNAWSGRQFFSSSTGGTTVINAKISGDSNQRFWIEAKGELNWGDGTNSPDTNLYRSSAGTLKTDGDLVVGGTLTGSFTLSKTRQHPSTVYYDDAAPDFDHGLSWGGGSPVPSSSDVPLIWEDVTIEGAWTFSGNTSIGGGIDIFGEGLHLSSGVSQEIRKSGGVLYLDYDFDNGGHPLIIRSGSSVTERLRIDSAGNLSWGGGSAISSSDDVAEKDEENNFTKLQQVTLPTVGNAVALAVDGDGAWRFLAKTDGYLEWGDGANPRDTNLYRSAANTLKTDDSFVIGGSLDVTSVAMFNGIEFGDSPATTGPIRLGNAQAIAWRNFANDGNVLGIRVSTGDTIILGGHVSIDDSLAWGAGIAISSSDDLIVPTNIGTDGQVPVWRSTGVQWEDQSGSGSGDVYVTITGNTGTVSASGEETLSLVGAGAISTDAAVGTPDTITISVDETALSIATTQLTGTLTKAQQHGQTAYRDVAQTFAADITLDPSNSGLIDGGSISSPQFTLTGYYDSDATTAIVATSRSMHIHVIVDTNGSYRLAIKDDAQVEVGSITSGGDGTFLGTLSWGGGAAISSSDSVSLSGHTHDDRYYTESEVDTLLSGKSDTGHAHAAADITSGTLASARLSGSYTGITEIGTLGNVNALVFDGGDARITIHDGSGNFNIKSGIDHNNVINGSKSGGSHIRMDDNDNIYLQTYSGAIGAAGTQVTSLHISNSGVTVNGTSVSLSGHSHAALSAGTYLTGSNYDGTVARTFNVDATESNTASKVVARNASGDIFCRLVRSEYTGTTSNTSYFVVQHTTGTGDNYHRPATQAQVKSNLGISNVRDVTNTYGSIDLTGSKNGYAGIYFPASGFTMMLRATDGLFGVHDTAGGTGWNFYFDQNGKLTVGTVPWASVTSKPATATRWPAWSEVTSKPSLFTPTETTNTGERNASVTWSTSAPSGTPRTGHIWVRY